MKTFRPFYPEANVAVIGMMLGMAVGETLVILGVMITSDSDDQIKGGILFLLGLILVHLVLSLWYLWPLYRHFEDR